jgi:hypothetical protein
VVAVAGFVIYNLLTESLLVQPMPWPPSGISSVVLIAITGGAVIQVYRYHRSSSPVQRQQSRWVVFGVFAAALGLLGYLLVIPLLFPAVRLPGGARVYYILFALPVFHLALLMLPFTLLISILRYRLWDIDVLISRTLVYVPLTAILAGLFASLENVTQDLSVALTGQESEIATVATTLLVVATFTPLRNLLETIVERRFKDRSDNLERLEQFAERVRTRVTPLSAPQVLERMLAAVVEAFEAKGGAAYLGPDADSRLLQTAGKWDGEAALCIPIEREPGATRFGTIALDEALDGVRYSEPEIKGLEELGRTVASALEEDQAAIAA